MASAPRGSTVSGVASLTIEHLLIVSYAVPPERVRSLVPPELVLDTITDAGGRPLALVSAVAFHARSVTATSLVQGRRRIAIGYPRWV